MEKVFFILVCFLQLSSVFFKPLKFATGFPRLENWLVQLIETYVDDLLLNKNFAAFL